MKAQHTPGPWELHESNAIVGGKIDDHRIWLRPVIARFETGVSEANAHLIAAAPELLEALLDLCHFGSIEATPDQIGIIQTIGKARAAIAKATGSDAARDEGGL